MAMALATLGDRFDAVLDVTIVYPGGTPSLWNLLCGQVNDVVVRVREVSIPAELLNGESVRSPAYRAALQTWVATMWAEKDRCIDEVLARSAGPLP
jgi:hypothetical protein